MDFDCNAQLVTAKWEAALHTAKQEIPEGAVILLSRPYSMHPDDWYLSYVMAQLLGNTITPYVTWLCNVSSGTTCFHYGNYFADKWEAFQDWKER